MTAATSTLEVRVDAGQALRSLADIKKAVQENTSVLDRFRQASSGGFDRLEAAMNKAVGAIDRMHATMQAMASGMGAGTAAAVKQATALEKLAAAAKAQEVAAGRAAAARSTELADLRALESARTRAVSLELRLSRQLSDEAGFTSQRIALQDKLTSSVQRYTSVIAASGANSVAGIKARGELQRDYAGISSEVARLAGLIPKLKQIEDKIPARGWAALDRTDKLQLRSNAINFVQQSAATGQVGSALVNQGPEVLALIARMGPQAMGLAAAFVAVGGALAVVGSGFSRLFGDAQKMRQFTVAIQGSGQAGKVAAADLQTMVARLDAMPGVARDAAEATVSALARIRGLGQQNVSRIAALSPDFAAGAGLELKDATSKLAGYFKAPGEGARALAVEYGALSAASVMLVEKLMRQGRVTEAQGIIADALARQFKGLADKGLSPVDKALSGLGNAWGSFTKWLSETAPITAAANAISSVADSLDRLFRSTKQFDAGGSPVLSMPMPSPLAPGALPGAVDKGAEVLGAIDALKQYQGVAAQRRELSDVMARGQSALKIATDPSEIRALKEGLAGAAEAMRQLVDAKQKVVSDSQRSAANEWRIADSPFEDRDRLRTVIESENAAREAGLSTMQKEDLIRARLSEGAAKYLTSIQDSVRAKGYEADATERLAAVESGSIVERQRAQDVLEKERFRREALSRATADNRDQILSEVAAYESLIDRMGQANSASQLRSAAISYSPTLQYEQFQKDAGGIEAKMREMGAPQEEITAMYEQAELRKLDASRKWEDGVSRGLKRVQDNATNWASQTENLVTNAFSGMEDALVQFSMTGKLAFGDLARSILADMIRMQVRASITGPLSGMLGNAFGGGLFGGGKAGGGTTGAGIMPGEWDYNAKGGAFDPLGKVRMFARGGAFTNSIVDSPTLFKFANGSQFGVMGEAGAEAVMPLRRGPDGSLGVMVAGASGGAAPIVNTTVNVSVEGSASSGDSEMDERQAQRIARAVDGQVRATVVSELQRQMRGGGMLNRV